jgi:acyl-CoA thioesterase FadM
MNFSCAQQFETNYEPNYVVNDVMNRQYSIVYDGSSFGKDKENCIIPVKNRREIELLLLSLGEEATVIMDEQARKLCNVWDWLYGRTYSEVFTDLKWSYHEEDEVLNIIERIPMPKALEDSFLRLHRNQPEPESIGQEFVHKKNPGNVIISKPFKHGNMFYFNGFSRSAEFNLDHNSDHLEGIVIFEAVRQAGIASVHLAGVPLNGAIVILETTLRYKKFVECSEPYLIRTIPAIKQRGGYSYGVYNVVQKGQTCATGYFTGMVYKSKESYQKFRNIKFVGNSKGENELNM